MIKRKFKFLEWICHLFHLVKRDKVYSLRGFATHEIRIFASLDEINGIVIKKNFNILFVLAKSVVSNEMSLDGAFAESEYSLFS